MYGGVVYMDLSPEAMQNGFGSLEYLQSENVPRIWLIYSGQSSESGRVHAPMKERWLNGDPEVLSGMKELASIALCGR